jgi:putative thioredoxin
LNEQNSAFRGAVDLSALANKVVKEKIEATSGVKVDTQGSVKVPALAVELTESILRSIIQLSSAVPVVVCFYESTNPESISLTNKLEKLALSGGGRWLLGKVDMIANAALTEAFGVTEPATVAMILKGEPKALFQGDQEETDLAEFLRKLVEVAASQGIAGQLEVEGDVIANAEPQLSEAEQQALDAMDKGDFSAAVKIYEAELQKNPGNDLLVERLAQVKLVERTYAGEIEKELLVEPKNIAEAMRKADFFLAIGDADSSFNLLLDWFDKATPEERSAISSLMLELFNVVGKSHPSVNAARKALAVKMF